MFGQLKAKLSGFVDRLIGREEKKERAALPPETPVPQPKPADEEKPRPVFEESIARPKPAEEKAPILGKSEPAAQARPARTPEKKVENELQSLIEEKKGTTLQKEVGKKPQPFIGEKKEPAPAKADSPVVIAKEPPAPAPPPPKTIGSSPPKKLPVSAAPEPVPSQKPSVSAASEPKKDFLSSIWPFQKPKEEKKEAPPVLAPGPQEAAPKIPSGQKAPAQSAHENLREPTPVPPAAPLEPKDLERLGKKALFEQEREMKIKLGLGKNLATLFSGSITITEEDVRDLIDDLELSLLESDVAYEVSLEVAANLKKQLVGMKVPKGAMHEKVNETLRAVLTQIMASGSHFDFFERVASLPKPAKILFIGPNGAGKTTTMAKIAHQLKAHRLSAVLSASDTFRAAAIEQAEVHAARLGIPIIKSSYGADPASVAFDAIKYAKSHQLDVVLIDSAGRQDTNQNLIDELKKIDRVIKPDLKIYVGESIGGNALMEQVAGFHKAIGIDGAILTKLDCDAKGGTAISLAKATGVPILFLGTGQGYDDLIPFDADEIAKRILAG